MATQVQFRRGTETQNNNFTGAAGELSVNLSNYSLRLHDGVTAGGYEMARANMSNVSFGATVLPSSNTTYNLGSSSFKFSNVFSQTFTGALVGNASTATKLFTARNINGVAFDGTQNITIKTDKTLTIGTGLSGGTFDGATDVTVALQNSNNFIDRNLLKWDATNGQFVNSLVTSTDTTASVGGNLTVSGASKIQSVTESFEIRGANQTGTQTYNFANNAIYYHPSVSGNITVALSNVPTDASKVHSITIVFVQGATARKISSSFGVNGSTITVKWSDGIQPSGSVNRVEAFNFTIINTSTTATPSWTVIGSSASFA